MSISVDPQINISSHSTTLKYLHFNSYFNRCVKEKYINLIKRAFYLNDKSHQGVCFVHIINKCVIGVQKLKKKFQYTSRLIVSYL